MDIAVVTGAHWFPEPELDALFSGMDGISYVREELEGFVDDPKRGSYDVVVFYNFHGDLDQRTKDAILELADSGRGIVVLHHAVLAFPGWPEWREICGLAPESFGYDEHQAMHLHVEDPTHPVTAGMSDFDMVDETYRMGTPDEDCHVLLTVDHPKSMKHLAWVRSFRKSRVFWFQSGHDNDAYANPGFRQVLSQAIRWVAN